MDNRTGLTQSLHIALSGLQGNALAMQLCAYNLANVSTSAFEPVSMFFATGPSGQGVRPQPPVRAGKPVEAAGEAANNSEPDKLDLLSGTDIAHEISHMLLIKNSFAANARTIQTVDELAGIIVNIKT